jgi:hypothetical protein
MAQKVNNTQWWAILALMKNLRFRFSINMRTVPVPVAHKS